MKRARNGATEPVMTEREMERVMERVTERVMDRVMDRVMERVRNGATEPVMTEREMERVMERVMDRVMERVRNGATEPVMTEREMERVMERVTDRVRNGATEPVMTEREMERVMERVMQEMQEIKRLIETLSKQSAPADCNGNPRTSLDQAETSEGRGYQLLFDDKLPSIIFTDNKIKDKINESVKIVLFDTNNKEPVTTGPLSSIKIRILVLDGDFGFEAQENWTEQDFNAKVVHEREGKRPLVTGELNITLRDGVGIISDLSFTDNSSWIKCRKFRLGARVVQSIGGQERIKEAISEAFVVKDHRAERYGKHHPPSSDDEVWRLEKIKKDGKFHRQLASQQIETVKDFMRMYVTNPTILRELLNCPKGAWDTIVEHASTCAVDDEKFYAYSVEGIGLLFNSIYGLVAAAFDGHNYQSLDKLSVDQKSSVESIKEQAYRNVSSFVPFNGRASVPSKSLTSLQDEPISSSTTGSAEMQIDCYHSRTSSSTMGGLQVPVAQNTLPQVFEYNELDELLSFYGVPNLAASEMASQDPVSICHLVNVTWEHNNGFYLTSTSNDSEFGYIANTHGMQVVHGRDGKRSPVAGKLNIMLRDGVGIISDLSFTDNSSWIKCRKFSGLDARVVQSIGEKVSIKEAISEAFVVKDHRTKIGTKLEREIRELERKNRELEQEVREMNRELQRSFRSSSERNVNARCKLEDTADRVMELMMQEIKHLIETLNKQSAPADCNGNPRTSLDQAETSEGSGYQLLFANKLPSTIFTDSKIEAEIGGPVKIVLIDTISKAPVTSGPLSSIKIQILVLDGDFGFEAQENWTEKDFDDKIVHEREGKRPLVTGELNIMLRDGVGIISDLSLTDNSSWIKCRKFRLGARVVQSIGGQERIKEAISEAFVAKDNRVKWYGKHHPPSLDDEVWRLEKIRKDGPFHQRLASHQIDTVKDFMRKYVTDPIQLREMLFCSKGAWDKIVEHASTCAVADEEFYDYSAEGIGLLFNSIYMLVAATFDGHSYQSLDKLSVVQKSSVESIKEQAYRNVSSFVQVDRHAIFGPSNPLISLQAKPYNSPTSDLQSPEFPVAEQGSAEMHCYHSRTSSSSMGGLQVPVAQNTHLPQVIDYNRFGNFNIEMDEFPLLFSDEFAANLASEMASQDPMSIWPLVNVTWEHNNGFNLPSTSNDSEFGHVVNSHGMQQAVDPMSTRSPLTSAISGNNNGHSVPIGNNSLGMQQGMSARSPHRPAKLPDIMHCYTGGTSFSLERENYSALCSAPISNNSELASFSNTRSINTSNRSLVSTLLVVILVGLALFRSAIILNCNGLPFLILIVCKRLIQGLPVSLLVVILVGLFTGGSCRRR